MGQGSIVVSNQNIANYIRENIIARGFLSKTTPDKRRARPWPDNQKHTNGSNDSWCTVAYEWEKARNRWNVFHFGPNGEIKSLNAIFDKV